MNFLNKDYKKTQTNFNHIRPIISERDMQPVDQQVETREPTYTNIRGSVHPNSQYINQTVHNKGQQPQQQYENWSLFNNNQNRLNTNEMKLVLDKNSL